MVLHRNDKTIHHERFESIVERLPEGSVLVVNNSQVIPARLRASRSPSPEEESSRFEILLLEENATNDWWAMVRPGKRAPIGKILFLRPLAGKTCPSIRAEVVDVNQEGHRRLRFHGVDNVLDFLTWLGELPLPPYIKRNPGPSSPCDLDRYQTVYAAIPGSVAAPTAGLHFTERVLDRLQQKSIQRVPVTLHVGVGTFAPVKVETLEGHVMHSERYHVSEASAEALNRAIREGRPITAVGTTSLRVLESAVSPDGQSIQSGWGRTQLFVYPPYPFKVVRSLITNFHLPESTLLMLVCAFADPGGTQGREWVLNAYAEAVRNRYRFFSYGDAMFIQ